jgi:stage III sporulation protein AD
MSGYLQAAAGVLLAVILVLALGKEGKQTALLVVLAVVSMIGTLAVGYLQPVVDFVQRLAEMSGLDQQLLAVVIKAAGISLIGEMASLICADTGNGTLAKGLKLLSAAVILRLSLPLMERLVEMLESVLGEV